MMTLTCPECGRSLEPLYVGEKTAEVALQCPGCGKSWLNCEVCDKDFLIELHETQSVPYLEVIK